MSQKQPDPTPEEIAERCAEIRAGWSDLRKRSSTNSTCYGYDLPRAIVMMPGGRLARTMHKNAATNFLHD